MEFLLAILLPPLAVWRCGQKSQVSTAVWLTVALWLPGVVYAIYIAAQHTARQRRNRPRLGKPNPFGAR